MNYLIILTLLLTPTYTIRFSLFGFPTNLLMVWVLLVWIAFCIYLLIKPHWQEFVGFFGQVNKKS